jgi:hypothetical protein
MYRSRRRNIFYQIEEVRVIAYPNLFGIKGFVVVVLEEVRVINGEFDQIFH